MCSMQYKSEIPVVLKRFREIPIDNFYLLYIFFGFSFDFAKCKQYDSFLCRQAMLIEGFPFISLLMKCTESACRFLLYFVQMFL